MNKLQAADGAQGECPKGYAKRYALALAPRRIRPCVPLNLT